MTLSPAGVTGIKPRDAAGMLKDRIRIQGDDYSLEKRFEEKASGGSLRACRSTTIGQKQLQKQNEDKNSLCSCSSGKDLGIVLNEKLNMNQRYFLLEESQVSGQDVQAELWPVKYMMQSLFIESTCPVLCSTLHVGQWENVQQKRMITSLAHSMCRVMDGVRGVWPWQQNTENNQVFRPTKGSCMADAYRLFYIVTLDKKSDT